MNLQSISSVTTNTAAGWKYPGQYDYRSIDKMTEQSGASHHSWQIDDYVDVYGNRRACLRFDVISADGVLGFEFTNDRALSVWPYWLTQPPGTEGRLRLIAPTDRRTPSRLYARFAIPLDIRLAHA
jgi:hypothetical protein